MQCPKCGFEQLPGRRECHRCGLEFARWRGASGARRRRAAAPVDTTDRTARTRLGEEAWLRRGLSLAGAGLLLGFLGPLLKHSVLHGASALLTPWQILFPAEDEVQRAATATLGEGGRLALWVLVPLIAAVLTLLLRLCGKHRVRAHGAVLLGGIGLLAMLAGLPAESEILGLVFVPPSTVGGLIMFVGILSLAVVAAANHARKRHPTARLLRRLSAGGAVALGILLLLALLAGGGAWKSWSMWLLYLELIGLGVLAIRSARCPSPDEQLLETISLFSRVALGWLPLACWIAQSTAGDPFVDFVIGGGGGAGHVLLSIIKGFLVYGGLAYLMALGLAATLTRPPAAKAAAPVEGCPEATPDWAADARVMRSWRGGRS